MGDKPVYSKDLVSLLSDSSLAASGSVEADLPLSAYRIDAKFSIALKVSGSGTLKVTVLVQSLPNGDYAAYADGSEIVTGYGVGDGELVFDFSLPVCRSARFVFTEDGGSDGVVIETASLCFV